MIGIKLNQYIDVAFGAKVIAQDRPEEGKTTDVIAPTVSSHRLLGNIDAM